MARSYTEDPKNVKLYVDDLIAAGLKYKDIFISCDKPSKDPTKHRIKFHHGFISEQYEQYLQKNYMGKCKTVMAFTCGPPPMMKAVNYITTEYKIPLKVLMEKRMACGIGVCFSCVCKTEKNGKKQYSRVCIDGPIFDAKEIKEW